MKDPSINWTRFRRTSHELVQFSISNHRASAQHHVLRYCPCNKDVISWRPRLLNLNYYDFWLLTDGAKFNHQFCFELNLKLSNLKMSNTFSDKKHQKKDYAAESKQKEVVKHQMKRSESKMFEEKSTAPVGVKMSQNPSQMKPSLRMSNYKRLVKHNRKNNMDTRLLKLGYNEEKSVPFVFQFSALNDISLPDVMKKDAEINSSQDVKLYFEFYFSFFYKKAGKLDNKSRKMFIGRTCKTRAFQIKKDKSGNWGFKLNDEDHEFLFYHSSLTPKSGDNEEQVNLIIEGVISKVKSGAPKEIFSGGYIIIRDPFAMRSMDKLELAMFIKGSPRDLLMDLDANSRDERTCLSYIIRKLPQYDKLKHLIPQHNFVTKDALVPGLDWNHVNHVNSCIPSPPPLSKAGRSQDDKNLVKEAIKGFINIQASSKIYLHQNEIHANPKFESELLKMVAQKEVKQSMTDDGKKTIEEDLSRNTITERKIVVKMHNTWQQIGEPLIIQLRKLDRYGIYHCSNSAEIDKFRANEYVALVFEFIIVVEDRNKKSLPYLCGYEIILPELNSLLQVTGGLVEKKLQKGPGQNLDDGLIICQDEEKLNQNFFEFSMKTYISTSKSKPRDLGDTMSLKGDSSDGISQRSNDSGRRRPSTKKLHRNQSINSDSHRSEDSRDSDDYYIKQTKQHKKNKQNHKGSKSDMKNLESRMRDFTEQMEGLTRGSGMQNSSNFSQDNERMLSVMNQQQKVNIESLEGRISDLSSMLFDIQENLNHNKEDDYYDTDDKHKKSKKRRREVPFVIDGLKNAEMGQIANVFYNILNMVGTQKQDQGMIDMAHQIKDQVTKKTHRNLFGANVPLPGAKEVNFLRVYDLEANDIRHLMENGMGQILKHPAANILTQTMPSKDRIDLTKEMKDPLIASTFEFKIVSYKPANTPSYTQQKNFFFQMRFFTFEPIRTEQVELYQSFNDEDPLDEVKAGENYFLKKVRENHRTSRNAGEQVLENIIFIEKTIDPSISKIRSENMDFAEYLKERYVTIDMFDSKTHFFFGSAKIPLFEMLRQQAPTITRAKEVEIYNDKLGMEMGSLVVIMTNTGKSPAVRDTDMSSDAESTKSGKQPSQGKNASRIIYSEPMSIDLIEKAKSKIHNRVDGGQMSPDKRVYDHSTAILNQMSQQEIDHTVDNPDLRKKLRIERIRKMAILSGSSQAGQLQSQKSQTKSVVNDPKMPDWKKYSALQEIEIIRQTRKAEMINDMYHHGLPSNQVVIQMVPGQMSFHVIKLPKNNSEQTLEYQVSFSDPDEVEFGIQEVSMINGEEELDYYRKIGKITTKDRGTKNIHSKFNTIDLPPGERFEILLKFMTYREFSKNEVNTEFIRTRTVRVDVVEKTMSNQPFMTLDCKLEPTYAPIDHVYRYHKPQNSYFEVRIPPFIQFGENKYQVKCSKPLAHVTLDNDTNEIVIRSKAGESMHQTAMTVFVQDGDKSVKTVASIRVEIQAVECLYAQTQPAVENQMALQLQTNSVRTVRIFTNNTEMAYLPQEYRRKNRFMTTAHMLNTLPIVTKTFTPEKHEVVVNAVDYKTGELVKTWLLVLASLNPIPTQKYKSVIEIPVDQTVEEVIIFKFKNDTKKKRFFTFDSSDEVLMRPETRSRDIKGMSQLQINIAFQPQSEHGTEHVFLYITDEEQYYMECVQFEINYIGSNNHSYKQSRRR